MIRSAAVRTALAVLLGLVVLELAARAVVAVFPDVLPDSDVAVLDRHLQASGLQRLYRPDRDLLFALRPSADDAFERSGAYDAPHERFHVRTNDRGYRTPPFATAKAPGVVRIVCLGDASTFGAFVEEAQTYPRQLAARLEEAAPGGYEVINLGVPGYTSRQGLELLQRQVLALDPDIVVFAFGTADRTMRHPQTDDQRIAANQSAWGGIRWRLGDWLDHLMLYRLLAALGPPGDAGPPSAFDPPRASVDDITAAIVAAQALLQANGGRLVVLNADFAATDAMPGIAAGVQRSGADFVDAVGFLQGMRNQRSGELARRYRLRPPPRRPGKMTFRVEAREYPEVWLETPRQGEADHLIPMHDDGSGGDQVAHDGVFTVVLDGTPGRALKYTYRGDTVLGPVREFSGKKRNPTLREVRFTPGWSTIDRYREVLYLADPAHPDADGQAMIAQALAAHVRALPTPSVAADETQ